MRLDRRCIGFDQRKRERLLGGADTNLHPLDGAARRLMSGSADAEAVVTEVCGVQEYLRDANVLPTRVGAFDVTACMTRPGPYPAGEQRRHVLIRRLEEWPTECDLVCMPVYDFSRASTSIERVRIRRSSDP